MSEVSTLRMLLPLPESLWGGCCVLCDKPQARWTIRSAQPAISVCALCILYTSPWGKRNAKHVADTTPAVAQKRPAPLEMVEDRLYRCEDADSVLGVLVLVERTVARMPK